MLSLRTTAAMERALCLPLDATLRSLLEQRMEQLRSNYDGDLGEIVEFHIVELGDTQRQIEAALGFPVLQNFIDGTTFGDPDWSPCFEWLLAHGSFFEITFILGEGYGCVVFVPDDPAVEFDLHSLCLEHAEQVQCGCDPPD
jgi:hypothetical protein